ncbi:translation initiation factor IF-2 [Rhizosphaericola mali]|uniref:Translation initiation factor IF-2 n=1 Tax=Rhizosphaericola mali TaxID=2545455 RepID=A0A5P2G1T2_9BACT|nr:translation initiation factor IF-2 [Rhizosphaericola mali]QES89754.1 translation initiation factor IF-2 [Rhizosphaericola mali]
MSELKLPRLLAAAKEFNIGRDTLVEFLVGKGFNRDDLNGNVKLEAPMYRALQQQFLDDKVAKDKADRIEIPKGLQSEKKKKEEKIASAAAKVAEKEEDANNAAVSDESTSVDIVPVDSSDKGEVITTTKEENAPKDNFPFEQPKAAAETIETSVPKMEEVKLTPKVENAVEDIQPQIVAEKEITSTPKETEKTQEPVEKKETPAPEIKAEPINEPTPVVVENVVEKKEATVLVQEVITPKEEQKSAPVEKVAENTAPTKADTDIKPEGVNTTEDVKEPEVVKFTRPELEGPKILDKIDLSGIDSSTRPKKGNFVPNKNGNNNNFQNGNKNFKPQSQHPQGGGNNRPNVPAAKDVNPRPKAPITPYEYTETKKTVVLGNPDSHSNVESVDPVFVKIQAEKLEGPKILGKIELPVDNDTRPKVNNRGVDEKRKRKRIPIDKKGGDNNNHPQQGNNNQNRPYNNNNGNRQGQGGNNQNRPGQQGQGGPQRQGQGGPQRPGQGGNNRNFNNNNGNRNGNFQNRNNRAVEENKEIDQKKIQEKIRETQAKLAGNSRNNNTKNQKAKHRRERRQEMEAELQEQSENRVLNVTEFITVSELANLMDVSFADIISKCMSLGIMVSINQRLDAEVIELVAGEFDYTVSFIGLSDEDIVQEEEVVDKEEDLLPRSPIVTIMGHVDHGKTSLLDYIRNANVVAGEAGGITQHIGAYVVTLENGRKITFLDTPGHEAFTAMRARGAKVTDIAVIVVAADDAVMPQTKEAISHAQAAGVPMIFAINKIDKDGANPAKIYEQLSGMNILVEEWGGTFQNQEIAAKQGLNVNLLLEKICLEADMLNLKANPNREASGSIVEASLDKGRGYVATVLVQNGTLHQGDLIVSGQYYGRAKAMFNERNQRIEVAGPSTPVQILGLNGAPQAGEKIKVYTDESEAKEVATTRARILREQGLRTRKHITLDEIGRRLALGSFKELNVIIKGDVDGSVEALSDSLQKLSTDEIVVNVIFKAVGQISESDVLLATASDAIIIGFNVRASSQAGKLAQNEGVQIKSYSIIYNAIEEIKSAMEGMLEPKVEEIEVGTIEIREVYKFDKVTVAGSYVTEGRVKRDSKIRIFRDGILVYPRNEGGFGELGSLKRYKDDVKEVIQGYECGLTLKNFTDIQVGDNIVAYQEEEVKRTL